MTVPSIPSNPSRNPAIERSWFIKHIIPKGAMGVVYGNPELGGELGNEIDPLLASSEHNSLPSPRRMIPGKAPGIITQHGTIKKRRIK